MRIIIKVTSPRWATTGAFSHARTLRALSKFFEGERRSPNRNECPAARPGESGESRANRCLLTTARSGIVFARISLRRAAGRRSSEQGLGDVSEMTR